MEQLLNSSILVTGGAGFIGSHIVEHLVEIGCKKINVLDNLETGFLKNIESYISAGKINFIQGDITDKNTCLNATKNVDVVLHQAALGSVPRSIEEPLKTHAVNVDGFINTLEAARKNKVKRFVYASSSSVYGNDTTLPKKEERVGDPLSPYAVSKKVNELYASVYANLYGMDIIGLRYFNVFGPRQNPSGPYAAVIPIFISNILNKKESVIYGDGSNRRDFTYVKNVVQANMLAATVTEISALNQVYNIAFGSTKSVKELFELINGNLMSDIGVKLMPQRPGEIKDSFAAIEKAATKLGYRPSIDLEQGIKLSIDWYKNNL